LRRPKQNTGARKLNEKERMYIEKKLYYRYYSLLEKVVKMEKKDAKGGCNE
jgi:hypothetical protein